MTKIFNCVVVGGLAILLAGCGGGGSSTPVSGTSNISSTSGTVTQPTSNTAPNDGNTNSTPTRVTVTASIGNAAPVANAGAAQSVAAKALVTLDGTISSDANSDPLTYTWTLTSKPVGSAAVLSQPTSVKPTFTADVAGTYVATLLVNDGKLDSAPSTTSIAAIAGKYLGISYLARNNLSVVLNSITTNDQGNGYNTYTISYTQTNKTPLAIDEAALKLYFKNDVPMLQYGFFNKVYPGTPVSRTYTFTQLNTSILNILEYDQDNFFAQSPVSGSLQWSLPVQTNSVSQGGFTWTAALSSPYLPWDSAFTYCANGTFNDKTGWRLPTQPELSNLVASGAIIGQGWTAGSAWSSTSSGTNSHYIVNLSTGSFSADPSGNYVTCVQ